MDGPARQPRATVIIVNWNGAHLLPGCLDAVASQRAPFDFRTVVVDNASTDDSVALIRDRYPHVDLLQSGSNLGFAGGNNLALRSVTTPYAVLLNNDAVPDPDWLVELLAPFEQPGADRLGAVSGKVLLAPRYLQLQMSTGLAPFLSALMVGTADQPERDVLPESFVRAGRLLFPVPDGGPVEVRLGWRAEVAGTITVSGGGQPVTVSAEDSETTLSVDGPRCDVINNAGGVVLTDGYGADRALGKVDDGRFDVPEEVLAACGNGMALRTTAGQEAGWFDDAFFVYYEDTDLSWRLRLLGWDVLYVPGARLRHLHAATSGIGSELFRFHTERNRLLMLTKNASAPLVARAVLRFPLTTVSLAVRQFPDTRILRVRVRAFASYLRLLPAALRERRRLAARARLPRRAPERFLVPVADFQRDAG